MVLTIEELYTNKNFILKIAVLLEGILVILLQWPKFTKMAESEFSHLLVIIALLITYMFFESTPATEICLLAASLTTLAIPTAVYIFHRVTHERKSELMTEKFYIHASSNVIAIIIIIVDILLNVKLYRQSPAISP